MKRAAFPLLLLASGLWADDPELLARDFVRLSIDVSNLGGSANLSGYKDRQRRAIPLYREFLHTHPDSVYSTTVRWSLFSAYLSLQWQEQASQVLDEIQDSLVQELLRVSFAQKNLGNTTGAGQLLEGLLAKTEHGGIQARAAQYLYMTGETEDALKRLNAVIEDTKQPDHIRGRALLIKAELFRFPQDDTTVRDKRIALLRELVTRFPATQAGGEGKRKLRAALLSTGDAALPFTVTTVTGATITSTDLKGKAILLYFWATWSYPSWRNLKELRQAIAACAAGSIVVIGAACDTYVDRPRNFFAEKQVTWPLVAEGNKWRNSLAQLYDVRSLPYYVLVNRYGKIVNHGIVRLTQPAHIKQFMAELKTAVSE